MPDRRPRNRIARRLAVFGPAAIVVLTGVLAAYAVKQVTENRDLVQHTHDVLDASSSFLTAMLDAETASRGYVLLDDSTLLRPYSTAPRRASDAIGALRRLTSDNPAQQLRIDTLEAKGSAKLALIDSAVQAKRQGRFDIERFAGTSPSSGPALMTTIRLYTDSVKSEEERLLGMRRARERQSIEITVLVILLGTLVAGALAFSVNRNFDQALIERRKALDEATLANERLQETAIELEHQADAAQNAALEAEQSTDQAREAMVAAEESERRAERLQEATEAFTGALELKDVATLIVDQSMQALGAQSGALAAYDEQAGLLRILASRNIAALQPGREVSVNDSVPIAVAARERRPIVIGSIAEIQKTYPMLADLSLGEGAKSGAVYPLRLGQAVVGVIMVRFDREHELSAGDRSFMNAMSRIATETFERARSFEGERQARWAAESANRAKAAFLASMSHELRTPLQAALGFAQLVRSGVYGPVNENQAEVLGRVERSQTHLARLIDDILDFARLEAGRVRVQSEVVSLNEVFGDLAPLVEPQAAKKKIELSILPPPDDLQVKADRQRLQQVLVNLVGNAIKFTPENGMIRVGALPETNHVAIQIRDTGIGIPEDRLQAIFEPFVQVEDALTRTASGTGLGLAISRDLARAMGGDLTVESELGKGSTFEVKVPLAG